MPVITAWNVTRYRGVQPGPQVPNEEFIKKAPELHADVLLVSQTVTQKDVHIQNLTNLIELLEAEGLRDKFVVCCAVPCITHELAKELGYDAGFGAGKYADDGFLRRDRDGQAWHEVGQNLRQTARWPSGRVSKYLFFTFSYSMAVSTVNLFVW